jgi:hypothetical protein
MLAIDKLVRRLAHRIPKFADNLACDRPRYGATPTLMIMAVCREHPMLENVE